MSYLINEDIRNIVVTFFITKNQHYELIRVTHATNYSHLSHNRSLISTITTGFVKTRLYGQGLKF